MKQNMLPTYFFKRLEIWGDAYSVLNTRWSFNLRDHVVQSLHDRVSSLPYDFSKRPTCDNNITKLTIFINSTNRFNLSSAARCSLASSGEGIVISLISVDSRTYYITPMSTWKSSKTSLSSTYDFDVSHQSAESYQPHEIRCYRNFVLQANQPLPGIINSFNDVLYARNNWQIAPSCKIFFRS